MRTRSRRSTAVTAVAVVLTLAAAGCASREDRGDDGDDTGNTAGWDAGVNEIQIGLVAPMTGPFAVLGVSQENSMQVVVDQLNEAGGIGGAEVSVVTRDVGLDPARAVAAATELAGDPRVKLVVGPSITSFYNAAKGIYEDNQMVNCQPAVAGGTFDDLAYGFRSQDRLTDVAGQILRYLESEGVTTIGEVYEADDTGAQVESLLTELGPQYGISMVGYEESRADDQTHLPYVQNLSDAGAIWISSNASGALTMAAAGEAGYEGILVGGSGLQNISFLEAAGDAAAGAAFAAPNYQYPLRDRTTWKPGYLAHIEAIEEQFGVNEGPNTGATSPKGTAIAADCVYAYAQAADAAQSIDATAVAEAMEGLNIPDSETPSGCTIAPGPEHEFYSVECIRVYQWQQDSEGWFTTDVTPAG